MKLTINKERISQKDAEKIAVFSLLAHETAKHAEAVPGMLIKGKAKFALGVLMKADTNLLRAIQDVIFQDVDNQMRAQNVPLDVIAARKALVWREEWTYFEECSEILAFVVETLIKSSPPDRLLFLKMCRTWAEGNLEIIDHDEKETKSE